MVLVALIFVVATVFHILSTPLYLLLGLAVATAAISYWSDQLGMKLGKKRITLMGLRPRQTATLISILSSLAIMIVTLAAMLVVYEPLRNALFRFDIERERNKQLVKKSQALENNNAQQQQSIAERTRKNELLSRELNKQNTELQLLGVRVEKSQRDLSKAGKNLRTAQVARNNAESARRGAEAARNEAQAAQIRAQSAQTSAERARQVAQSGLAQAQQREAAAQRRTAQAQQRYAQAQAKLSAAVTQLRNAQSSFKRAQADVEQAEKDKVVVERKKLNAERGAATATNFLRIATANLVRAEKELVQAEKSRDQVQNQLIQARAELTQAQTQLTQTRTQLEGTQRDLSFANIALSDPSKIVVSLNQTLGSATLPANASEQQAREVLTELLSQGRRKVRQDGFESLYLAPVLIGEVELGEEQIIPTLARNLLSRAANPYSIRLLAARDHALGETEIVTRLLAIEVKTAFEKGEVLADITIEVGQDSASSDARIFNQLFRLVDGAGRAAADERRVVPLLTVETPNFFAPDTNLRIFEAMREIQELETGRRVSVKLVAADTVTTIESPSVRFEID